MRQQSKLSCGSTAPSQSSATYSVLASWPGHYILRPLLRLFRPRQAPSGAVAPAPSASEGGGGGAAKICMTYNHANLSRNPDSQEDETLNLLNVEFFVLPISQNEIIPAPVQVPFGTLKGETGMIEGLSAVTPSQLKRCRELAGLSVTRFAAEIGLNRSLSLREMESGKRPISGPIARNALLLAGVWPFEVEEPRLFHEMQGEFEPWLIADPEDEGSVGHALKRIGDWS